jgi:hypothetical protein
VISDTRPLGQHGDFEFALALVAGDVRLDFKGLQTNRGPWKLRGH